MLGALRDEVVPEVLGGRPADDDADRPAPAPAGDEHDAAAPAEQAVAPAEPEVAPVQAGVDDTGDVTRTAVPDAPAAVAPSADAADSSAASAAVDAGPPAAAPPVASAADLPAAPPALDEVCAAAVDLARAAAVEEAGSAVGEHLGVDPEDALTVTHSFATTDPAYTGWRWAVTVARADGVDVVTVDEVVLLPGAGALLAPVWVPYSDRVQPGDLGAGDLLPPAPDDVRLVPAWNDPEADVPEELWDELFLGRPRVLSLDGRADAAERWHEGDTGPRSPRALAAPGDCAGCGFLVPLAGALRRGFGVCANAQAPDDGRVVALGHGCGAHSETPVELTHTPAAELVVDDVEFDFEGPAAADASDGQAETDERPEKDERPEAEDGAAEPRPGDPLPDPADEQQAEELGHS